MTTTANVRLKLTGDASQAQKEFSNFSAGTAVKFGVIATVASKAFELILDAGIKALKGIVIEGAHFETKMKTLWAVTGEGKEVLLSLEKTARDLGKTTIVSATEAADAMLNYARAGFSADQITKMMKGSIELSVATATDLATVADTVASAINQFGMNAGDTSRIVDVLAMTANKSAVDIATLQQSLVYAGSVGKAFGLSFEEVNAILGELGNVGHRGSIAGTELARALVELSTPTDRQADALGKYNISLEDVNAETHKITDTLELFAKKGVSASDIMVIFGQEAGKGMASLIEGIRSGKVDFDKFIKDLENAEGATKRLSDEMTTTVENKYKIFTSALTELNLKLFDAISQPLADLLDVSIKTMDGINEIIEDSNKKNMVSTFSTWEYIKNVTEIALTTLYNIIYEGFYVPIVYVYDLLVKLTEKNVGLIVKFWSAGFNIFKLLIPGLSEFIESQKSLGMTTIDLTTANDNLLSSQNEVLASYDNSLGLMTLYHNLTEEEIAVNKRSADSKDHKSNSIKGLSSEYKRLSSAIDSYNVSLVSISLLELQKPTFGKRPTGAIGADIFGVEKSILPEKTIFPTETFDDREKDGGFFEKLKNRLASFVIGGFEEGVSILSGKGNLFDSLGKGLSSTLNFAFENSLGKLSPLMSKVISGVTSAAIALPTAIGGDLFSQLMSVGSDSKERKEKLSDVTEQIASLTEKRGISSPEQKAEIDKRIAELELQQKELQKSNADILHDQFELTKQKWLGMFDNLIEFMPMLVDAFGDILQQILLKLPDVVKVLANNIDDIILMIAGSLDEIIVSLASAMPYVALALAKAMPVVAIGLVTAVVEMIDKLLGKIGLGGVLDKPVKGLHNLQENTIQALMGDTEKTMGKRHSGGNVFGGDNVPMMLQGGEFVMSRRAVNKIGVNALEQMNQGQQSAQKGSNSISITINAIDQKSVSEYMKGTFIPEFMNLLNDNNRINGTTLRRELRFAITGM